MPSMMTLVEPCNSSPVDVSDVDDSTTMFSIFKFMNEYLLLVVGNRELSGFISMALELANSFFPTSSRSISLEEFATRSKQTNMVFVAFLS